MLKTAPASYSMPAAYSTVTEQPNRSRSSCRGGEVCSNHKYARLELTRRASCFIRHFRVSLSYSRLQRGQS